MGKGQLKPHIVIFVEGDTDQIFFEGLLEYYRKHSSTPIHSCEVKNLKGVSRYTSKVIGKLKNEICPKAHKKGMEVKAVCCSYDTDVFEFAERPIVDWKKVDGLWRALGRDMLLTLEVGGYDGVEEGEMDGDVRIFVGDIHEDVLRCDGDGEFFHTFADEGGFLCFAGFDFSADKFP